MIKTPLFKYSLTLKAFTLLGIMLCAIIAGFALLNRLELVSIPTGIVLILIGLLTIIYLALFLYYVTFPLENIALQILNILTGKSFHKIPPIRNDEIGVITHFYNQVIDKMKDLSINISEGKRMSSELALAARIQADVLPKKTPDNIIGLDIVARSKASSEVGGDCFDFINTDNKTLIYIGDVTGHGVAAGLIMMLVSSTIRILAEQKMNPRDILIHTNKILKERISSQHFMSLVMLCWDNSQQRLHSLGAGHEYILHYSVADQTTHAIKSEGIALKMVPDISKIIKEKSIDFKENDVVVLYTDGITEAKNHTHTMYGLDRLKAVVAQNAHRKSSDIFDKITEDFSAFLGRNHIQEDDISLIVLKNIGQFGQSRKIELSLSADTKTELNENEIWKW